MSDRHKTIADGSDLNARVRKSIFVGTAFNLLLCVLGIVVAIRSGRDSAWFPASSIFPLVFALNGMLGLRQLFRYPPTLLLQDGIDIGGRFVPYSAITTVKVDDGWGRYFSWARAVVAYNHHGLKSTTYIGSSAFSYSGVAPLMAELSTRAGLQAADSGLETR